MKKIIAMLLALIMVCSLATTAFAADKNDDGTFNDESTITFTKWYNNPNNGVSPVETFTFTHEKVGVTNGGVLASGEVVNKETMPDLESIASADYAEGDAGKVIIENGTVDYLCKRDITVTLPKYDAVGIYTYEIREVIPGAEPDSGIPTTGVVYYAQPITLVVTVIEQEGKVRVAAVHTEIPTDTNNAGGTKKDTITNVYESGSLAVSKTVTGNMGDKNKEFDVTVTFIAPDADGVKSTISYVEDGTTHTIAPGEWDKETNKASVVIKLKDGETITFTNIPASVNYTVEEADYSAEGYDAAKYEFSDNNKLVDKEVDGENHDTCAITNNKEEAVDTGIALDSAPYILMLVVAMVGMVALVSKKRYEV